MTRFGGALFAVAFASLACGGGIWEQAMGQAAAQEFQEMQDRLAKVADGANKEELAQLLDEGIYMSHRGDVGLTDLVFFGVAFDEAVADGTVDDHEIDNLRVQFQDMKVN